MRPENHRRRVLLFLIAILLPCVLLVILSLRIIGQERELADTRLAEERSRWAGDVRQELLARLERIKFQEVGRLAGQLDEQPLTGSTNPAVALVVSMERGRLVLPWQASEYRTQYRRLLQEPVFASRISQGQAEEFARQRPDKAVGFYRDAAQTAGHPTQEAYARLLLARALANSGQLQEASALYWELLHDPSEVADEHGVPFALYAAERLLASGNNGEAVLERLMNRATVEAWSSPAALYLLSDLMDKLSGGSGEDEPPTGHAADQVRPDLRRAADQARREVLRAIRHVAQAVSLQRELPGLLRIHTEGNDPVELEPLWIPFGDELWLVGTAPVGQDRTIVVAVDAEQILASLEAPGAFSDAATGTVRFHRDRDQDGELLGPTIPGLKVVFEGATGPGLAGGWNGRQSFYLGALLLGVSATLFVGYLLWRDVRREVNLSEMRTQFVSNVSHELKTPLTSIRMFAETLQAGRPEDPRERAEYLETIVQESERLSRLLDNVLDFSRIERGEKAYTFAPTPLAELLRDVARTIEDPLRREGFELRVHLQEDLPPVEVDRDAIEQAVLNLLVNAMKYSAGNREIDLCLSRRDRCAVIAVVDRGMGIRPEDRERIFEKFVRAPVPEVESVPGAGLGLTLVAHIVEAHGGRIEVASEPEHGSTFSLLFPLEERA